MDMSQIRVGDYAENFQFLSKPLPNDENACVYRLRGGQLPSECAFEDLHLVLLLHCLYYLLVVYEQVLPRAQAIHQ